MLKIFWKTWKKFVKTLKTYWPDVTGLPTEDVTRQTCEVCSDLLDDAGDYDEWLVDVSTRRELSSRGVAALRALPFNTDYADVSLKASHCAGCIVILPIVFPLSAPTWPASASFVQYFTLAALITAQFYCFFGTTAVRLNVLFFFFCLAWWTAAVALCFYKENSSTHLVRSGCWLSWGGAKQLWSTSSWPLEGQSETFLNPVASRQSERDAKRDWKQCSTSARPGVALHFPPWRGKKRQGLPSSCVYFHFAHNPQ